MGRMRKDTWATLLRSTKDQLKFDALYVLREGRRKKSSYGLGCLSVFLVVFMAALLFTVVQYSALVFLVLAESESGQLDLQITADGNTGRTRVNLTLLQNNIQKASSTSTKIPASSLRLTPRLMDDDSILYKSRQCLGFDATMPLASSNYYNGTAYIEESCFNTDMRTCLNITCNEAATAISTIIIDSDREKELGIGRAWNHAKLPKHGIYVHEQLAKTMSLKVNDYVLALIPAKLISSINTLAYASAYDFRNVSQAFADTHDYFTQDILISRRDELPAPLGTPDTAVAPNNISIPYVPDLLLPLQVMDIVNDEDAVTKFGDDATRQWILLEYDDFLDMVANATHPAISATYRESLVKMGQEGKLRDYARYAIGSLPSPRYETYLESDYATVSKDVVDWGSNIMFHLGVFDLRSKLPVLEELRRSQYFSAFLNLIVGIILLLMGSLAIFLVFSLLMVSVETKTFEMAVLRMVGMDRRGITILLFTQSLSYAIPAWIFGVIFAQVLLLYLRYEFQKMTNISISPIITPNALLLSTLLGLVVPLISAIIPIRNALKKNLHDSLQKRKPISNGVVVTLERSQDGSKARKSLLLIGIALTASCVMVYYFLPLSLVRTDIALLFNIFLAILVSMIAGMVLLASNIQSILERFLTYVMFLFLRLVGETEALRPLVLKNLVAHKLRNRKTSLMYALSLGFIIFLNVAVNLELKSLTYSRTRSYGTQVRVQYSEKDSKGRAKSIPNAELLEQYAIDSNLVQDICYVSAPLDEIHPNLTNSDISNLGQVYSRRHKIYGISPNLFTCLDESFLKLGDMADGFYGFSVPVVATSASNGLYSRNGFKRALLSAYLKDASLFLGNTEKEYLIRLREKTQPFETTRVTTMKPLGFVKETGVFRGMTTFDRNTDALVSFPTYIGLSASYLSSVRDIPLRFAFIKLYTAPNSQTERKWQSQVARDVRTIVGSTYVRTIYTRLASVRTASTILDIFFQGITVLAMVVAFFSLNSSMFTNIIEQKKEIGIMRSLGLTKFGVFRLYVYESFILVTSASFIGIGIGTAIGTAMGAQRALFTQVPISFLFPGILVGIVISISLVCSIISTLGPVLQLNAKNLVKLLR